MNIKNHYPVYMQGELIALYPKNPTTKKPTIKLSQTTTARRIKCAVRRVLNKK